ncbi:MAG: restriction endonuclease [Planctomycetes bacterium]|nr:restriction endonuclease [Planctomycetota bacterium]
MTNDGKKLERFVASVERRVLKIDGWSVETNKKLFDDNGKQIAEFDVIITGGVGTASFTWLIECRDRPSEGAAPGAWIEQLYGRREKYGFSKVTAVSTTGFTDDARKYAESRHIELRELRKLDDIDVEKWLRIARGTAVIHDRQLISAFLVVDEDTPPDVATEAKSILEAAELDTRLLRSDLRKDLLTIDEVFHALIRGNIGLYDGIVRDGKRKTIKLKVDVPKEDPLWMQVGKREVAVRQVIIECELWITEKELPLLSAYDYIGTAAAGPIARIEEHGPLDVGNGRAALSFERVEKSDLIKVSFRMLSDED